METDVAIIGAGPAGLMLGHLLRAKGISAIVVERASMQHVLGRIRAGVLERSTVDLMKRRGLMPAWPPKACCTMASSLPMATARSAST